MLVMGTAMKMCMVKLIEDDEMFCHYRCRIHFCVCVDTAKFRLLQKLCEEKMYIIILCSVIVIWFFDNDDDDDNDEIQNEPHGY